MKKMVILRRPRSGRLEGRTTPQQRYPITFDQPSIVFHGLGPGIHERLLVDGRAKPGHDDGSADPAWADNTLIKR